MVDEPLSLIKLQRARAKESKRLMEEYDRTVYWPAVKKLRDWCVENGGHKRGNWHANGLGWSCFYCSRCGDRFEITGPDGKEE